jgi:hypothetical protein
VRVVALDNEFITVECDPEAGIVQHVMHRFVISDMFRQGLEAGLALMRDHGATKWLSDDRQNSALSNDDIEWAAAQWQPRAVALGLAYWALVLPEAVLGQMRSRRVAEAERRRGVNVEVFTDRDSARRWLEQQPSPKRR